MEQRDYTHSVSSEDEEVSLVGPDVLEKHRFDFFVLLPGAEQEVRDRQARLSPWVRKVYRERERFGQKLDATWWRQRDPDGFVFELLCDVAGHLGLSGDFVKAKPQTEELISSTQLWEGQRLTYSDHGTCKRIQYICVRRRQEENDEERQRSDCWCALTRPLLWQQFVLLRTELSVYFLLRLFEGLEESEVLHQDVLTGAVGVLHLLLIRARNCRRRDDYPNY